MGVGCGYPGVRCEEPGRSQKEELGLDSLGWIVTQVPVLGMSLLFYVNRWICHIHLHLVPPTIASISATLEKASSFSGPLFVIT